MLLRIFTEPQQGVYYDDLLRVARAAEDSGYDAFFRSDHLLAMGEASGEPGSILDSELTIACGDNAVRLLQVQREGKSAMDSAAFLRGAGQLPPKVSGPETT